MAKQQGCFAAQQSCAAKSLFAFRHHIIIIPGTEEIPFVQTWPQVLKKRGVLTLVWIVGAAVVAGIVVLLF